MGGWHYFATRLHGDGTETIIATEIPLEGVTPRKVLSGPDDFGSPSIPIEVARLRGEDGRPIFVPWSSAIYAEKDGLIRAGGILTDAVIDGPSLALTVEGFTAYPFGLPYDGDRRWIEADPLDIARHIWEHLQAKPNGNLGLVLDDTSSDARIGWEPDPDDYDDEEDIPEPEPYRMNFFSTHDLGRAFDDLAEVTPFDFSEEHYWDGDTIRHRLRLGYPSLGRRRRDLRFAVGENVSDPTVEAASDEYANEILLLGAGEGASMISGTAYRETDRLRRVAVVSDESVTDEDRAARLAERELTYRLGDDDVAQIEVIEHANAPVGSWSVGDEIRLQGSGTGWAGDLDLWVRVLDYTYESDERSIVTVRRSERT